VSVVDVVCLHHGVLLEHYVSVLVVWLLLDYLCRFCM
jgi:hypothetical protein